MMAISRINTSLSFTLKKEQDISNNSNGDTSVENVEDLVSMPLPSLSANNFIIDGCNSEFLHLTGMVRTVYLSYLHKCLLNNYTTCCEQKDEDILDTEVKKYAEQIELNAVQLSLEAGLYRRNMLKMITDIKTHTLEKKKYKKLIMFLESAKDKIDVAVQTIDTWMYLQGTDNIQSICITSNCEEMSQTVSPVNSSSFYDNENIIKDLDREVNPQVLYKKKIVKERFNDASQTVKAEDDSQMLHDAVIIKNEDDNTQDSLLQHMENMFCESDDSSDLMKLIEKHSSISKVNIDEKINEICSKADTSRGYSDILQASNISKSNVAKVNVSENRISFSRYKEMRDRRISKITEINENKINSKQRERINSVWFVERVHQISKLKAKMTELSLKNYRKHGIVKERFLQLFGESEEEEVMSDSPICIEEHLSACKERIAPWIVKYLMPFYKKRRIKDRQLFKAVAKYIGDMLIIENTFPEQKSVSKYIDKYFKNKRFIKTKQDIYL